MARTFNSPTLKQQNNARYRAWQSMRILRRFTIPEIVATAEIGRSNADKYIRFLVSFGYIRIATHKRDGARGGHAVYMLVRNTGPSQPVARSTGALYDANTGYIVEAIDA